MAFRRRAGNDGRLYRQERADTLDYINSAYCYETLEQDGTLYILAHAGLRGFETTKELDEYEVSDFLWERARHETPYFYRNPETPLLMRTFGVLRKLKNAWNLSLTTVCPTSTQKLKKMNKNRGVAKLVSHRIWDAGIARSSRVTPTKIADSSAHESRKVGMLCGFFNIKKDGIKNG